MKRISYLLLLSLCAVGFAENTIDDDYDDEEGTEQPQTSSRHLLPIWHRHLEEPSVQISENGAKATMYNRAGNVEITVEEKNTDSRSRFEQEWDKRHNKKSSEEEKKEKRHRTSRGKDDEEEKENKGPEVKFSVKWSN